MPDSVPLATGDIDRIERLYNLPGKMYITCPERDGACAFQHGPNRPDDLPLMSYLDYPNCSTCGCSLVIMPRSEYDGPPNEFRDLDKPGTAA